MTEHIGVLSDRDIRKEITLGNIILHDPDRECLGNIQNCSVDITLGPYFYRNDNPILVYNPWNAKHIQDYWGTVQEATVVTENDVASGQADILGLKENDRYILLQPGESILGHTREFIGGLNHITTMIKARSSMGRSNITICRDAGWGDIGFISRWTLEISNNGTSPVVLPVGARVGQVIFLYTGVCDNIYSGKYQTSSNHEEEVRSWNPSMMLPRLYLEKS